MSDDKKRINFSATEKSILRELVMKNASVIENKKSDAVSASAKKLKWQEIAKEFSQHADCYARTTEQLRKCWDNIKSQRKKEITKEKQSRMMTGGGKFSGHAGNDPELDSLATFDIEMSNVIDSDTIALVNAGEIGVFEFSDDGNVLQKVSCEQVVDGPSQIPQGTKTKIEHQLGQESSKRLEKYTLQEKLSNEIHLLKVAEYKLRIEKAKIELKKSEEDLAELQEQRRFAAEERGLKIMTMKCELQKAQEELEEVQQRRAQKKREKRKLHSSDEEDRFL